MRYCEEIEGVSAITLAGRGSHTTISTVEEKSLLDTTCELCGGCIDVCPTGAMNEKLPLMRGQKPERELVKVRSTCNFCGVGCQLDLNVDPEGRDGQGQIVKVTSPPPGTTTNDGNLCVKGRFAYDFVHHKDRLTHPLVRGEDGALRPTTWDDALERAAEGLFGRCGSTRRRCSGFCEFVAVYDGGKFSRSENGTRTVSGKSRPPVRGHVTRANCGRSGRNIWCRRDDKFNWRDTRCRFSICDWQQYE